ncbi:MAG: hypothetical protein ACRDD7_10995 [Peptostreptococcaceae bacterium]
MKNNWLIKGINILCIILLIYSTLFITLHFIYPDIGELSITLSPSPSRLESRIVSIHNPKVIDSYYLLIYEAGSEENWLYFNTSSHTTLPFNILKMFAPENKSNYLLLEGNKQKNQFTFTITSKYPLTYMASKQHIFNVHYIVPFKIFPFPTFYLSKYYTFFVDPLI